MHNVGRVAIRPVAALHKKCIPLANLHLFSPITSLLPLHIAQTNKTIYVLQQNSNFSFLNSYFELISVHISRPQNPFWALPNICSGNHEQVLAHPPYSDFILAILSEVLSSVRPQMGFSAPTCICVYFHSPPQYNPLTHVSDSLIPTSTYPHISLIIASSQLFTSLISTYATNIHIIIATELIACYDTFDYQVLTVAAPPLTGLYPTTGHDAEPAHLLHSHLPALPLRDTSRPCPIILYSASSHVVPRFTNPISIAPLNLTTAPAITHNHISPAPINATHFLIVPAAKK